VHPIEKSPHAELASSCLRSGVLGVRAAEMSIDAVEGYSREPILRPWRAGGTARKGAVDAHGDPGDVKRGVDSYDLLRTKAVAVPITSDAKFSPPGGLKN
jgi:hypothetical protein